MPVPGRPPRRPTVVCRTGPHASPADELAAVTGAGLLGVLRALSHDRIRPCASPTCDGMCVGTGKAGRRRYCTPALCGNRLDAAAHRARQGAVSG
ncbi:CGNR zinc finger domain-containing protein [Streptomyces sp. NPDC052496]|uniref:CGNR zinc finger domain-containing protein n=1 Tax=Streptomyces sp. NPDC052496 TaxID=3154951 RepID=UPI003447D0EA